MGLGHKVAVMVRLIEAAVNDGDRPQMHLAGQNNESWLRQPRRKSFRPHYPRPLDKAICGCNTVITTENEWRKP